MVKRSFWVKLKVSSHRPSPGRQAKPIPFTSPREWTKACTFRNLGDAAVIKTGPDAPPGPSALVVLVESVKGSGS